MHLIIYVINHQIVNYDNYLHIFKNIEDTVVSANHGELVQISKTIHLKKSSHNSFELKMYTCKYKLL